ncbi:uncharacterized protein LOC127845353 isoform X1 [Dreissena polymorpha]|uniref:C-type lectin domain-containing protein n=1 Tax=Dreissena polymorpha TaxID=45954 RepID=A0A9D4EBG0_DREPO|nr:uncharacterized protein LOC127845353 isoform X1 [Dreissena polymorpha]KAH3777459.1 hypothetical protein DPMN_178906 [Dreissena polymorpha]
MNWMDAQNICTSKGNLWDPLPIDKIKQYVHWIAENEFVWLPKYPGGKLVELNDSVSLCLSAERLENLSFTWRFENCANSHGYVCADDPDKFAPHMISLNAVRLNTMFEVIVGTSTTRDFTKDTNQDTKTKSTTLTTSRKTKKSRSPTTVIPSTITSSLISPSTDTTNTTQEKTTEPTPSSIKYSTATNTSTSAMHNVTFGESSRGSDDTKDSTTVIWFVIGGIGIVGFIVGTIGTVYGCRREDCRRLSRQSLKRFRNGQTIISMDPGSNAVAGQPLSSVGVQPDLTHMYIHAINDEYEEIKSDRTIEVNLISQSVEDNSVYYEIDPDDIIEREVTPIYWSPKVRVTHQFDGSLELRSMSQEPSYAIGRIAASSAPVEKPCVVDKKTTECRSRKE